MKKVSLKSVLSRGDFTGNIDSLKNFGTYLILIGSTGLPEGITGGILIVFDPGGTTGRITQILTDNQTTNRTFIRKVLSNVWMPWREL